MHQRSKAQRSSQTVHGADSACLAAARATDVHNMSARGQASFAGQALYGGCGAGNCCLAGSLVRIECRKTYKWLGVKTRGPWLTTGNEPNGLLGNSKPNDYLLLSL